MLREELTEKKEMVAGLMAHEEYKPMKFREMAGVLQVPKPERGDLREILDELIREGKVQMDENGRYTLAGSDCQTGIFCGTQRGFGFVKIEGQKEDIFIPEQSVLGAMHGDLVQIRIMQEQNGRRREGMVTAVLERGTSSVVGTFQKSQNYGFVVPDNQKFGNDVFIPKNETHGAVNGHKVVAVITDYGDGKKKPEGKITEILGHINDPGVDILSVIRAYGLPEAFPEDVMKQAAAEPQEADSKEMAGRLDLRGLRTVTIDGEDAKDLDDAVTLSKDEKGYHLGVHIADVTHYVTENSAIDTEAQSRGTSVYLVDRVIPMLPHSLSNGICSLNEGVNRLALSCLMDIDDKGNVVGHKIAETVINVDRRMSYTAVKKIIEDQDVQTCEEYRELVPMFLLMEELAEKLRAKRRARGSIDFDFPESKIVMGENGIPTEIKAYERNKATKIIEDFMLIANETVAEDYFWQELPFVYRSHEYPDAEKIQRLGIFINNFGYSIHLGQDEIHPKEIQKLLDKIEGAPEEAMISRITLRSMKQAKYTTESLGHFGLAAKYYCHFTSPIRRYPDLQIHRIIKENLRGSLGDKRAEHYDKILPEVAERSSRMERRADDAERDVEKMKKAEYMSRFIGEVFEGAISGVTAWGFYVELPNTVEGMVHVTSLDDDYYAYDEMQYQLIGEHRRRVFKLGQKVKVVVAGADKLLKTVDFELAE